MEKGAKPGNNFTNWNTFIKGKTKYSKKPVEEQSSLLFKLLKLAKDIKKMYKM